MSEANGEKIIRIGRKGRRRFAFGEGEAFEVDVVVVMNQWLAIDRGFRDERGNVPSDKLEALNNAAWAFVSDLSGLGENDLTLAEALEFLKLVSDEGEDLKAFFVPKSRAGASSPERTELRFST